jgi:hypothetical protein
MYLVIPTCRQAYHDGDVYLLVPPLYFQVQRFQRSMTTV